MGATAQPIRLHLGCGKRYLPGWVHIDVSPGPHIDFQTSIRNLSMFADETVGQIYCSHALEYFDRIEVAEVLAEWRRVLVPGGKLNLAVPNFKALMSIYLMTGSLDSILGPLYGRMNVVQSDDLIYHKTVYDKVSLTSLLNQHGFTDVSDYDPIFFLAQIDPTFDDHSLAYFPHMDRSGLQVSLCLTAERIATSTSLTTSRSLAP